VATILFMGDSYGVPNYYGPPGVDAHYHVTELLAAQGHTIHCTSSNGDSNLSAINRASSHVSGLQILDGCKPRVTRYIQGAPPDTKFDLIVWFHTAILRDYPNDAVRVSAEKLIPELAHRVYNNFAQFVQPLNTKTFVIGGAAAVDVDVLALYHNPSLLWADWKQDIVQQPLPPVQTMGATWVFDLLDDSEEFKNQLVSDTAILMDHLIAHPEFPDNAHPGILPHQQLADKISDFLNCQ